MPWSFEKFLGCSVIYAFCPRCGFFYAAGSALREYDGVIQLRRCPKCERYLSHHKNVAVLWNERTLEDLVEYAINRNDDPV